MPETMTLSREHAAPIRNEPMQARSTARLAALLDSAAAVVAEIGYERLTTAMVADGAGASIGTVYRYFPDRIAVLQSLAARNEERITERVLEAIADPAHENWGQALRAAFEVIVDAFRTEPGFASLRFGDVIDLRPAEGAPRNTVLAATVFEALASRFEIEDTPEVRFGFEFALEACDSLVSSAFARDTQGDADRIEAAYKALRAVLAQYIELPAA